MRSSNQKTKKDKVQAQVYISTVKLKKHWENTMREVDSQALFVF